MQIQGSGGQSLNVDLKGYQFPGATDYWDGNWLMVAISANHPEGAWRTTDPSLLTFEVAELVAWLEAIADGNQVASDIGFIEPNLSFELVHVAGVASVRVYFELESRPEWAKSSRPTGEFWMDFALSDRDLPAAANSLRAQLAAFPVRGTPDAG
jgi:hypothetical protein